MPYYQKLGEIPRKHHIWFHRNGAGPGYKNEGIYYEHVITTEGFNEAFSIMYHLRPPTRVRSVKLLKCEELKKAADGPLRHHHLQDRECAAARRSLQRPRPDALQSGHDRVALPSGEDIRQFRVLPEWRRGRNHLRFQRRRHARDRVRQAALSRGGLHRHPARDHLPPRAG